MRKTFLCFFMCVSIIHIMAISVYGFSPSSTKLYNGIDVSQWQRNIDFSKVKRSGIEIVYIKSSEGSTYIDPYFKTNYNNAKKNGLKVGFYHYVTARNESAARIQAEFFVKAIEGTKPDCLLAMDFEEFGNLNNAEINSIALAFAKRVEELTNRKVVVYSNVYNARTKFNEEIANYPLWVANYNVARPGDVYKWKEWVGWQYTSTGKVDGINGNVDKDYFTDGIIYDDIIQIPSIPEQKKEYMVYTIKWGDTLSKLAKKFNTTVNELVSINNISNPNIIYAGRTLKIPIFKSEITVYTVKWGDTLSKLAKKYNTTVSQLVKINKIANPNLIYVGQKIIINEIDTIDAIHDCGGYILYTVKWGDTLTKIAKEYNTTVRDIADINGIENPNIIFAGEILRLYCNN